MRGACVCTCVYTRKHIEKTAVVSIPTEGAGAPTHRGEQQAARPGAPAEKHSRAAPPAAPGSSMSTVYLCRSTACVVCSAELFEHPGYAENTP